MPLTLLEAHALCAVCFAVDTLARGLRLKLLLKGLGRRITAREAMGVNLVGDAGCALTPYRVGGEPTRVAAMTRFGVPPGTALVAIAYEVTTVWPLVGVTAALLGLLHGREWWAAALPSLARSARQAWPAALAVLVAVAVVGWLVRRLSRRLDWLSDAGRQARIDARRMAPWVMSLSLPLTLASIAARVAVLPVLASTLEPHPPLGLVALGSFALLYSQLVLPTPAGAGVVDLGLVAGAAGDLGSQQAGLLLVWRFYSSGLGAGLGLLLAMRFFGWRVLRALFAGQPAPRRTDDTPASPPRHVDASI